MGYLIALSFEQTKLLLGIYLLEMEIRFVFGDRVELGKLVEEQYIGASCLVRKSDQESLSAAFLDGQVDQPAIIRESGRLGVI